MRICYAILLILYCLPLSAIAYKNRQCAPLYSCYISELQDNQFEFHKGGASFKKQQPCNCNSAGYNFRLKANNKILLLQLQNNDSVLHSYVIEIVNPFLESVLFVAHNGNDYIDSSKITIRDSIGSTHRPHPNFQYTVIVPGRQARHVLINLSVGKLAGDVKVLTWQKEMRVEYQILETKYLTYFFIINITFLLFIGIAALATRIRYHWYFFIYTILGYLFIYTDVGLAYKNLWPSSPMFHEYSFYFITNLYCVFGLTFVVEYFLLKKYYPGYNRFLKYLIFTGIIFIVIYCIALTTRASYPTGVYKANVYYFIFCGTMVIATAIRCSLSKYLRKDAIWFIIGFLPHAIAIGALCLKPLGWFNNTQEYWWKSIAPVYVETTHTPNILFWAVVWEVLVVFVLLIKRFVKIYEERNSAIEELANEKERHMNLFLTSLEKEKQRVAQELHDTSGVGLTTLKMKLNTLQDKANTKQDLLAEMQDMMYDIDKVYAEIRNISHNLMPKSLSKLGLIPAVEELLQQLQLAGVQTKFLFYHKIKNDQFRDDVKVNIYRIIQELLTNILKHANAKEATLQLIQQNEYILLTMEDDGIGFDPKEHVAGIGIATIRSRIALMQGQLSLDSQIDHGCFITISLPVEYLY